ncbi:18716_t:CDS:1, partial [Dentiscutata erythropus]
KSGKTEKKKPTTQLNLPEKLEDQRRPQEISPKIVEKSKDRKLISKIRKNTNNTIKINRKPEYQGRLQEISPEIAEKSKDK